MAGRHADIVLCSGRVFRGLNEGFVAAIAIRNGVVVATGTDTDIEPLIGSGTERIDLAGRVAVPGFNDAHQHLMSIGLAQLEVDLRGDRVKTMDELLRRVGERARAARPGAWVIGGRYDHYALDLKRHPYREELDRVAPNNPVFVKRTCGHMGVANSLALRMARVDESTPQPPGGHIERQNGRLTGLMQERAQELIGRIVPRLSRDELVDGLEAGGRLMLSQGVTSVMDAGVGLRQGLEDYEAYLAAEREGRLGVRAYLALTGGPTGIQDEALALGLRTGFGDNRVRIGPVKLFTDGSAGGLTAAMTVPYKCNCENRGIFIWSDGELDDMVHRYNEAGLQIALHAIGDAAIQQALNAVERANRSRSVKGRRFRIEHCGFITPTQITTMRGLEMTLAPQPIFIHEFGDLYVDVLGEERPANCYPMRSWARAGLHPAASSDAPVSNSDPMINLFSMVTRRTNRGTTIGAHEALTLPEAVHALTWNGAYASFCEDRKGRLVEGQFADLAVLDRDIFARAPEELLEARVDLTIVGGVPAYRRH
jgi:predicted amidohydrolase YtcJ